MDIKLDISEEEILTILSDGKSLKMYLDSDLEKQGIKVDFERDIVDLEINYR